MALLNYTSKIEPVQTIGEIQHLLSRYNVSAFMCEYEGRNISAVSFQIKMPTPEGEKPVGFRLPCSWAGVRQVFTLQGIRTSQLKHKDKDLDNQAVRTAWRIVRDWVEAQLALVEVNMVTVPQVFLPYMIMADKRILSEHVASNPSFLLGTGEK